VGPRHRRRLPHPYLWAEIVEDSDPLPDVAIEAVKIADPAERAVTQHSAAAFG
jgi:hypothetical protein